MKVEVKFTSEQSRKWYHKLTPTIKGILKINGESFSIARSFYPATEH